MIKLKEGKPQELEIAVGYQGLPYEKEVSFGVLADGELVFNENYTPVDGKIQVNLPPGDTTKQYTYVLETDDGYTKEQPVEVYAPKMRDIEAKKQFLEVDIDQVRDENTEQLLGAANEVYANSHGKIKELEEGRELDKQETAAEVEGLMTHVHEDIVPMILKTQEELEKTQQEHLEMFMQQSDVVNNILDTLNDYATKQEIEEKLASVSSDISKFNGSADEKVKSITQEIKAIKSDTTVQKLAKSVEKSFKKVGKEVEDLKNKTMTFAGKHLHPFFSSVTVSGQDTVEPEGVFDRLNLAAGSNVTLTTDKVTRTVTIASTGGGGGGAFTDLTDVPNAYTGAAGKIVKVNATEDGLEFATGGGGTVSFGTDGQIPYMNLAGDDFDYSGKIKRIDADSTLILGLEDASATIKGADATTADTNGGGLEIRGGNPDGTGLAGRVYIANSSDGSGIYFGQNGETEIYNAADVYRFAGSQTGTLDFSDMTADRVYTFQDADGTIAFLSDITGGTPGGSDTQVQFNDGGAFGGDAGFTYDKTTNVLTAGDEARSPLISTNLIQGYNFGSGSYLQIAGGDYGTGSGNGETVQVNGGAGGTTGGNGGEMIYSGGAAQAGNGNGGNISFFGGVKHGSGTYGKFRFHSGNSTLKYAYLDFESIATTDKTFVFPNASGTIALTSDVKPYTTSTDSATSLTLAGVTTTTTVTVFTGASNTTWTLPAVSGNTDVAFILKNRGTANISLVRAGSDNIYYNSAIVSLTIYPGESYTVINDGTYRLIV